MRKITFEEKKAIQVEMLKEIDTFCKEHKIRYSLAFGTLLGAIRHKGFIPWDDDVDIMMPLPDLLRFKELFKSDNIEYLDVYNNKYYEYPFSRLVHKKSYNQDGVRKGYGICIDLYVMIGVPWGNDKYEEFFKWIEPVDNRTHFLNKWRHRFARRFTFVQTIHGYAKTNRKLADMFLKQSVAYNEAKQFYVIAGPLKLRRTMTYNRDLFSKLILVDFEGEKYFGFADYDYYLTLRYGDYMQLPPEDQRVPYHGGNYYWKEDINGK